MKAGDSRVLRKTLLLLTALLLCSVTRGDIIYVDDDAAGANDGSNWLDAYNHLSHALREASAGDETRVAKGIYLFGGPLHCQAHQCRRRRRGDQDDYRDKPDSCIRFQIRDHRGVI